MRTPTDINKRVRHTPAAATTATAAAATAATATAAAAAAANPGVGPPADDGDVRGALAAALGVAHHAGVPGFMESIFFLRKT